MLGSRSRLPIIGVVGAVVLAAGCSTRSAETHGVTAAPVIAPEVPDVAPMDTNRNRIDDLIDARVGGPDEDVSVEIVLSKPTAAAAAAIFEREGGTVRHVFRSISHGFTGRIPRSAIERVAAAIGPDLVLVTANRVVEHHLDEATKNGRVRPIWAAGFAGTSGLSGSPTINIAIVDGGVDSTHPDLAGRMIGWKDYTKEKATTPSDADGHGTHVAGIALGSGAAFGVGPGPLHFTESGTVSGLVKNDWVSNPIHFPATFDLTSTATFVGSATSMSLMRGADGATAYTAIGSSPVGASPFAFSYSGTTDPGTHYTLALRQNTAAGVSRFAVASTVTNYPAAGDGFPAFRGVASSSQYYSAKVFPNVGVATTEEIAIAMDDLVSLRTTLDIKVVNCSFGITSGGTDAVQRAKVNTMVANGMVVVVSSGNNGVSGATGDPGRAASAITVGAVNDLNQLTAYSSGALGTDDSDDDKPDVVAPGGSAYRSKILSVDTNSADAETAAFGDVQANDYTSIMGTSMAAPFVSGAAALVIQALETAGTPWSFDSPASPFLVKMLLLASATETNIERETTSGSPTLGRSAAPRDRYEGYGIMNPDAAIEAATLTWDLAPITGTSDGAPASKRAWGRKITVPGGTTLRLALTGTADFDLYVYDPLPSPKGTPRILASSDHEGANSEALERTFGTTTDVYAFVKRVSGNGGFTLTGTMAVADAGTPDGSTGPVSPQGTPTDGGTEEDGGSDAAVIDAAPEAAPPVLEPEPAAPAPTPTAPPSSTGTIPTPVGEPDERFDIGGGRCSSIASGLRTDGSGAGGAGAVTPLATLVLAMSFLRRSRRRAS